MLYQIPFNKPYIVGKEIEYIKDAVANGKISGDGVYTQKCHEFFEKKYGFKKVLLTTSCTDALEMTAILLDIKPGDEIIAPSYTFVSTINPFILRGASVKFVDSSKDSPNIDLSLIEEQITEFTKAIVVVHYAGIACDMDKLLEISTKYNIHLIEDAAQAIDAYFKGRPLGSFGTFSTFSFHETKNIIAGEGGMLVINDEKYIKRAEIIREKGTNRSAFFRGEIDKYGWVDIGSSFLPSDIISAFLYAQLEHLEKIQLKRISLWNTYYDSLQSISHKIKLPFVPDFSSNNAHLFYLVCNNLNERQELILYLKEKGVLSVFHYLSLHKSPFFIDNYNGNNLDESDHYSDCLLRLPMYYELEIKEVKMITNFIKLFYENR